LGNELRFHCDPLDLVHDGWLVTLPRLQELPARDGRHTPVLLKFLSTTLLHRINELVRRHIRSATVAPPAPDGVADPLDLQPSLHSGVIARAIRNEEDGEVMARIRELEPKDREILLLRGVEQQPTGTVAMLLGLTPQAVSMRHKRALDNLRSRLPGSVFDEIS
jgi:DNA-directed RNA polymerase specialized sigma24 family protein